MPRSLRGWQDPDVELVRSGLVAGVSASGGHWFNKQPHPVIRLIACVGVEGDAHAGVTIQHRSRVRRDPTQLNLRQVHLIHSELHDELRGAGFTVEAGDMGENVTTLGIDLLGLPRGTRLHLGGTAIVEITGLRNPCSQLNGFQAGLMQASLDRDEDGELVRKAGVMAVVLLGGEVRREDVIIVEPPTPPYLPLKPV